MSFSPFEHPKGLLICFGTELWERFSYYGMRALLIFYLTQHLSLTDEQSYEIYGAYTALAWGLPVIGGILADRYLGSRKAVSLGAILLAVGQLMLALGVPQPGEVAVASFDSFLLSLALIVTGVGFLKTNITTVVGALYSNDDPRRDAGFTIFYLGINLGAAAAPLICGWLGQTYGWRYGFGVAGLGMLAGLLLFLWGQRFLEGHAEPPAPARLRAPVLVGLSREWLIYFGAIVLVLAAWQLLQHRQLIGMVLAAFSTVLGTIILYFSFARCTPVERDRMLVVAVLIAFSVLFWSLYEQMGSSLNLFADRLVDRRIFGVEIQASQLQALPGIFVILGAPLFTVLWTVLSSRNANPNTPVKFAISLLFVAVAFLMPIVGAALAGPGARIDLVWLVLVFLFILCGEMCMAPIALNMITRLCPKRVAGMMMGTFFLSLSIGSFVAAQLAKLTSLHSGGDVSNIDAAIATYVSSFKVFAGISIVAGVVLYLLSPLLYARMHDHNATHGTSWIARLLDRGAAKERMT